MLDTAEKSSWVIHQPKRFFKETFLLTNVLVTMHLPSSVAYTIYKIKQSLYYIHVHRYIHVHNI